jgi:hypothetical protein
MSPTPVFSRTDNEDFDWAIDVPDNHPVASEAGLHRVGFFFNSLLTRSGPIPLTLSRVAPH